MKPTPTLIRLHIAQGYLARARKMIESYRKSGNREMARSLDGEWDSAAVAVRRQAARDTLEKLLARVRKNRSITA